MHLFIFFLDQENIDESRLKPWVTPLLKHQKSIHCVFGLKNEHFHYGVYKIKLILVIQGNMQNHFCETFVYKISAFRQ